MNGKTIIIVAAISAAVTLIGPIRRPVVHVSVAAGHAVSQPFRHPKKDAKAVGGHVFHFFKGDR